MLADDLIAIDEVLELLNGEATPDSLGRSRGCRDFEVSLDAARSDEVLDSKALLPKLGVLVETGIDESLRLGGDLSSRLGAADGLKLGDDALARGGKELLGKLVVDDGVLVVGNPLGGVNNGEG